MANPTLAIDDALQQRARQEALRNNTSVNALVREFLGSSVAVRSRRPEAQARFEAVVSGSASSSGQHHRAVGVHQRL